MSTVMLKHFPFLLIIISASFVLFACNADSKVKETFTGTVETVNEYGGMRVNIADATDNQLGGLVAVGIPDGTTEKFNVGDKVTVGYNGMTFERAPVMVQAITLEKID